MNLSITTGQEIVKHLQLQPYGSNMLKKDLQFHDNLLIHQPIA